MKTTTEAPSSYSAPTAGLQKVLFSFGSTKDAAEFITTKSKLARYVGTQSWPGAPVASMAMEDMADPILTPPTRPTLEKEILKSDGTTEIITRDETNPFSSWKWMSSFLQTKPTTLRRRSGKKTVRGHTILSAGFDSHHTHCYCCDWLGIVLHLRDGQRNVR